MVERRRRCAGGRVPARAVIRARGALACAVALAALAGGCGEAPEHQAPSSTADSVSEALTGIAQACGEHAQLRALPSFGPAPAREAAVRAAARMRWIELGHAVAVNPSWIYQGKTLAEVHASAARHLRECGLGAVLA
jgi:hypothetical protein